MGVAINMENMIDLEALKKLPLRWGFLNYEGMGIYKFHENDYGGDECLAALNYGDSIDLNNKDPRIVLLAVGSGYEVECAYVDATPEFKAQVAALPALIKELEEARKTIAEQNAQLIEIYEDVVRQHCTMDDGALNSCAISTNADAMHWLADKGRIRITRGEGRCIKGEWVEAKQ